MSEAAATTARVAAPADSKPVMTQRQILLVIIGLMAGMFLSALDQTVVGTAIRTIGDDLKGLDQQAWVTTAYLITSTIATPIYGKLSDIFGRRPLFIFAIAIFVVGSIAATFSQSMFELAAFRAIQGIGAGGLMSMPLAIMGDILAPRERAKYQGYFLAVFGVSSVIGPLVGGLFSGANQILWIAGWRWVFLINVPIGVAALIIVLAFLHIPHHPRNRPRIDWWGASSVIVALVPLLIIAEEGSTWGWMSGNAWLCYIIGAVGIAGFLIIERAMKDDAIIPFKLFHSSTFSMATIIGVFVGFGMFGAMMTIPLYLQLVMGATPTEAGFMTMPMIGGLMIASIASGQIIAKTGKYRMFPIIGTIVIALGFGVFLLLDLDRTWLIYIGMFLVGLGLGQLMQTLTIASQNAVQPKDMGVATSSSTFFRQIGGTVGVAVLLSVLFAVMPGNIQSALSNQDNLKAGLTTALTPAAAEKPANQQILTLIWDKFTTPLEQPAQQAGGTIDNGHLVIANDAARTAFVDKVAPQLASALSKSSGTSGFGGLSSDTSFLKGADGSLSRPFLKGFNSSAIAIYWVSLAVMVLAFILTLFFKTPPLRAKSALQEAADARDAEDAEGDEDLVEEAVKAAEATGSPLIP